MPKAFAAPIPIHTFIDIDVPVGNTIEYCERLLWRGDSFEVVRAKHGPEVDRLVRQFGALLTVAHIAVRIDLERRYAYANSECVDPLEVDDAYLLHINPMVAETITYFRRDVGVTRAAGLKMPADLNQLSPEEEEWWKSFVEYEQETVAALLRHYPTLEKTSLETLLTRVDGRTVCWHGRKHEEIGKTRGPQVTAVRRTSTWATYCIAWLLGKESLAVSTWNSLLLPPEFKWGRLEHSGDYAHAKYSAAKKRLVEDLRWFIPEHSQMKPRPALPQSALPVLERMLSLIVRFDFRVAGWNPETATDVDIDSSQTLEGLAVTILRHHYLNAYLDLEPTDPPPK